jgi:hypothetical protein
LIFLSLGGAAEATVFEHARAEIACVLPVNRAIG